MKKYTIIYTRTLTLEETIEANTQQEAEHYAETRAWGTCELENSDFDESNTDFSVGEYVEPKVGVTLTSSGSVQ